MQAFINAFPIRTTTIRRHANHLSPTLSMNADPKPAVSSSSKRAFLASASALAFAQFIPNHLLQSANARVDIDTERFGDKGKQFEKISMSRGR